MSATNLASILLHRSYRSLKMISTNRHLFHKLVQRTFQVPTPDSSLSLGSSGYRYQNTFVGEDNGTDIELKRYSKESIKLVRDAGKVILWALGTREKKTDTKTCPTDLVTETDRRVEMLLVNGLRERFPTHKFIGEETTSQCSRIYFTEEPTWIIDPIDGTMNFVHNNPMFSISVGLIINRTPVLGIVYMPVYDQMYTALKGKGAYLNGKRIFVSDCQSLKECLFLVPEVWEINAETEELKTKIFKLQMENLRKIIPKIHAPRTYGSAAINLSMVASGQADAYVEFGISCWDMVAGALLVKEAGGIITDPIEKQKPFDYMNRVILASSTNGLAEQILNLDLKCLPFPREHPLPGYL